MKKNYLFLLILAFCMGMLSCANKQNNEETVTTHENDEELRIVAEKSGKLCPIDVDSETRWDSVSAPGGNRLKYYYTLTVELPEEFNSETFKGNMEKILAKNIKDNALMKTLKDKHVIFDYCYYDNKGKFIAEISISSKKYN